MNELYLALNTDLVPHDLARGVWEHLFDDWFTPVAIATDTGKLLYGDVADDTKLDGRGRQLMERESTSPPLTRVPAGDSEAGLQEVLSFLDTLDITRFKPDEMVEISIMGSAPSAFRVQEGDMWLPRFAPSLFFGSGRSNLAISFFDPSWIEAPSDLEQFVDRFEDFVDLLGPRRLTQIEWEFDGLFERVEDDWRSRFEGLPLMRQDYR